MSVTKVAKLVGVSRMTVSRVINDDPRVRPETADAVRKAIDKLKYVPPSSKTDGRRRTAKSVSGIHVGRLAFLIPDTNADAMRTTLTGRLLHGVDGPVDQKNLQLMLTRLNEPETLPSSFDRRHVDGILIRSADEPWLGKALAEMPTVWIFNTDCTPSDRDSVDTDNAAVGKMAAAWFLEHGHQQVLVINDNPDHIAHQSRVAALSEELRAAGGSVEEINECGMSSDGLVQALRAKLGEANAPTGCFIPGVGLVVSRVQQAIREAGFKPGVDIHMIGCGHDQHLIQAMQPQPVNIDIQPESIGATAADTLIWRLAHPDAPARRLLVQPKLVEANG